MTAISKSIRIARELDRLKECGEDFSPAAIAYRLNVTAKEITGAMKGRDDVRLIRKAHAPPLGTPSGTFCTEPMYYPSVWGFREATS